jgi:hypothetical protein
LIKKKAGMEEGLFSAQAMLPGLKRSAAEAAARKLHDLIPS